MVKMISQTTIDNVFETARVEEVIGDFVVLKNLNIYTTYIASIKDSELIII